MIVLIVSLLVPLIVVVAGLWLVLEIDINYLNKYVDYSNRKYGKHFNVIMAILLGLYNIALLEVLVVPNESKQNELIFIPLAIILVFIVFDNYKFWRNEYRN